MSSGINLGQRMLESHEAMKTKLAVANVRIGSIALCQATKRSPNLCCAELAGMFVYDPCFPEVAGSPLLANCKGEADATPRHVCAMLTLTLFKLVFIHNR